MAHLIDEISRRRTFAIISHPDAGKTTVTEQILLHTGVISKAGTVKARKSTHYALSDWLAMEKERGISVTSSVMQFNYQKHTINLLDTPGHADFSEDTYRTLTAVDTALMVIDIAKGVEQRTIKLMDICRLRTTPIITFINKLDRIGKEPIELLDEIEQTLKIECVPINWPVGSGQYLEGLYNLTTDTFKAYADHQQDLLHSDEFQEQLELVQGIYPTFSQDAFLAGKQTPVFFGSALNYFGISLFLDYLISEAPSPKKTKALEREITPDETSFSGFVFKIQANMDLAHRDRIAFLRICSGRYNAGDKIYHVRLNRYIKINRAITFMGGQREQVTEAWPGDIIGIHNHGTIQVGDTFTSGERLTFTGIPYFAPELFRCIRLENPLQMKSLLKGLKQLGEEGAVQVFRPLQGNTIILGAVGALQFDVVAARLATEYTIDCRYDAVNIATARWIECLDANMLQNFTNKALPNLAYDSGNRLSYLAPSMVNLNLMLERWPQIQFHATCEHAKT